MILSIIVRLTYVTVILLIILVILVLNVNNSCNFNYILNNMNSIIA